MTMTMTVPQPRPALRRAPDADVHPALVIPLQAGVRPAGESPSAPDTGGAPAGAPPLPIPVPDPATDRSEPQKKAKKAKGAKKEKKADKKAAHAAKGAKAARAAKRAKTAKKASGAAAQARPTRPGGAQMVSRFQGAGRATSDAVLFEPDRRVPLSVLVPKSIRDEIRDVARLSGATQDDLVSELLSAGLSDPRRW